MEDLQLRLLEPETDLDLFRLAFSWRTPKKHLSGPQMSFEAFSETNPTHLTIGLFNGELLAVYFLREYDPARYEAHFTSKKGVPRDVLLQGARAVINLLLDNGAAEICALVLAANCPLRRFATDLGMKRECVIKFSSCAEMIQESSIQTRNQRGFFIKYATRA